MTQNKMDTSACLPWMSRWPRISACPRPLPVRQKIHSQFNGAQALNLTEMDADKVPFLDSPVSHTGLFGPAVEGFAERFTATPKSSQAIRHFLPKRYSSATASSRPKMAPRKSHATSCSASPKPRHSRLARPTHRSVGDPGPR